MHARTSIPFERLATATLDGREVAEAIAAAYRFAYADPYRACTHNKVRETPAPFLPRRAALCATALCAALTC